MKFVLNTIKNGVIIFMQLVKKKCIDNITPYSMLPCVFYHTILVELFLVLMHH